MGRSPVGMRAMTSSVTGSWTAFAQDTQPYVAAGSATIRRPSWRRRHPRATVDTGPRKNAAPSRSGPEATKGASWHHPPQEG